MTTRGKKLAAKKASRAFEKPVLLAMSGGLVLSGFMQAAFAETSYNLNSTSTTVNSSNQNPVVINIGGVRHNISPGSMVTPAEMVAINQVLGTGKQTIVLGAQGNAVGGRMNVGVDIGASLGNLAVPHNVTALANFSTQSNFNLTGDLSNAGRFYAYSNNSAVNAAVINAANIFNLPGGIISSVVPGSLLGITGAVHPLSLVMNTSGVINNAGLISSSAGLTMNAAGGIVNALPSGVTGIAPSMVAATNLTMLASNIVNSGIINAVAGNINVATVVPANIQFNNARGILSALNGAINIRDNSFAGKENFSLLGGDVLSNSLNVFEGCGSANINVNNLTGIVNVDAGEAHVTASTSNLQLGTMRITGDPTFFNLAGDVQLNGDISTSGNALAIVASGDITSSKASLTIDTSSGTADSGALIMVAGANATLDPVANAGQIDNDSTSTLTIQGPSASGGSIDLGSTAVTVYTLASSSFQPGSVKLIAFAGANRLTGRVDMPNSTIDSSGGPVSTSTGSVTVLAAANSGTGVSLNSVKASGAITIMTQAPSIAADIIDGVVTGTIESGKFSNSSVSVGNLETANGANSILIYAGQDVTFNSTDVKTDQGSVGVFAGRNIGSSTLINVTSVGVSAGLPGTITMAAGVKAGEPQSSPAFDELYIDGPSLSGGSINLTALKSMNASGGGSSPILLLANQGLSSGSGRVLMPLATVSSADVSGGNQIAIIAGSKTAGSDAITIGSLNANGSTAANSMTTYILTGQQSSPIDYLTYQDTALPDVNRNGKGDVSLGNVTAGNVDIFSGGKVNAGKITAFEGKVMLTAGGVATISDIDVSSSSVAAGEIDISVASLSNSVNSTFNASGFGGGIINIETTDQTQPLVFGTGSNQFKLDVTNNDVVGASQVTIKAAGNLVIDANTFVATSKGDGATLDLSAGNRGQGLLLITNPLSATGGNPGGTGGTVKLSSNSPTPFSIGGFVFTNGVAAVNTRGGAFAGQIIIDANGAGGIKLDKGSVLSISDGTVGGGSIIVTTPSTFETSSSSQIVDATGNQNMIKFTAGNFKSGGSSVLLDTASDAVGASGGNIFLETTSTKAGEGSITIGSFDFILNSTAAANFNGGDGGNVTITATGNITVDGTFASLKGGAISGSTGTLTLKAGMNPTGLANVLVTGTLDLSSINGKGGSVFIESGTKTPFLLSSNPTASGFQGSTVTVSGKSAAGTISILNRNGAITVEKGFVLDFGTSGDGGHLALEAKLGDIKVTDTINVEGSAGTGGSASLIARAGNVIVPGNIFASGFAGNGGSVTLISNSALPFNFTNVAPKNGVQFPIEVSGDSAGSIYVENLGKGGVFVNGGAFVFAASKGDGAKIAVKATGGGNATVQAGLDVSSSNTVGTNGGSVDLAAPFGTVFAAAGIDASSKSGGNGGSISILSNSSKALVIDSSNPSNGVNGALNVNGVNAGSISLSNKGVGGITMTNASNLQFAASNGDGARLSFDAGTGNLYLNFNLFADASSSSKNAGKISIITNSAKPFIIGNSTLTQAQAPNSVNDLSANGKSGQIQITNLGKGGITVSPGALIQSNDAIGGVGDGGAIALNAPAGVMNLANNATIQAKGETKGGIIRFNAQSYIFQGTLVGLKLDASGLDYGGVVSVYSTAANKALSLGPNIGQFDIDVSSANAPFGGPGSITASSGGNLTVEGFSNNSLATKHDGAYLSFTAGAAGLGNLLVLSKLDASGVGGGSGGNVTLISNSATPFVVDNAATVNGIVGIIDISGVNGGSLGIKNSGDLTIKDGSRISANASGLALPVTPGTGAALDFESTKGNFNLLSSVQSQGPASTGIGGTIIVNAVKYTSAPGAILSIDAGSGGTLRINQSDSKTPLTVGASVIVANQVDFKASSTSNVVLSAVKGIVFNNSTSSTPGTLTLNILGTAGGSITTVATGAVAAGKLIMNVGTGNIGSLTVSKPIVPVPLLTSVSELTIKTSGNVYLQNSNLSMAVHDINQNAVGKNVELSSNADIDIQGTILSKGSVAVTHTSTGAIFINGSIFAPSTSLKANNGFIAGSGEIGQANSTVTLEANQIGAVFTPIVTLTPSLTLNGNTNTDAYVTNIGTIKSLNVSGLSSLHLNVDGSINTSSVISANGDVSLSTFGSGGGGIIVNNNITGGDVSLSTQFSGSIYVLPSASITGVKSVSLSSIYGNIGTVSTPVKVVCNTGAVAFNTGGAGTVNVALTNTNVVNVNKSTSGGDFKLTSSSALNIAGDLTARSGSITIISQDETDIASNVHLFAGAGDMSLQVNNPAGAIIVGSSASIVANGNVTLLVGKLSTPGIGSTQGNIVVTANSPYNVFFNNTDITANMPSNNLSALGNNVILQANGVPNITLDGGVAITANGSVAKLDSLDLSSKSVSAVISKAITNPNSGISSPNLVLSNGVIVSGDLFITNSVNLTGLTGLNIPAKVKVHFVDFDNTNPIGVQIAPGKNPNPIVNGSISFEKGAQQISGDALLFVNSEVPGTVFTAAKTSTISSDQSLSMFVGGDSSFAGAINAPALVSVTGTAGNNYKTSATTGTLSGSINWAAAVNNGPTDGFGATFLSTTAGLYLTGGSLLTHTLSLTASGTNNITQKSGTINVGNLLLESGELGASFSTAKNAVIAKNAVLSSGDSALANVSINFSSPITLVGADVGGTLRVFDDAKVAAGASIIRTAGSDVNCGSCTFLTSHLTANSNINATGLNGTISISPANAADALTVDGDKAIHAVAGLTVTQTSSKAPMTIMGTNDPGTIIIFIALPSGLSLLTDSGTLNINSKGDANLTAFFGAGIQNGYFSGTVNPDQIVSSGNVKIDVSGKLTFGTLNPIAAVNGTNIVSAGGSTVVTGSTINFTGGNSTFTALGANLQILSKGNIGSDTIVPNGFFVAAQGTNATNSVGGGLQISAGTPASSLNAAMALPPQTRPLTPLGPFVSDQSINGVLKVNRLGTGIVDLGAGPINLITNGGAILFDASSKQLRLNGGTFRTDAFAPIGFQSLIKSQSAEVEEEVVVNSDDGLEDDLQSL